MDNQNSSAAPVNNNPLASDLPVSEVVSALKNAPPVPPSVTTTTTISPAPIDITPTTPSVAPVVPSMTPPPVPQSPAVRDEDPSVVLSEAERTKGGAPLTPTNNPVMPPVPAAPVAPSAANPPLAEATSVALSEPAKESVSPLYENPDLVKVPGSK